jgi:hypothetical protein
VWAVSGLCGGCVCGVCDGWCVCVWLPLRLLLWGCCGCCVAAVRLLCGCCMAAVRLLCGCCVAAAVATAVELLSVSVSVVVKV